MHLDELLYQFHKDHGKDHVVEKFQDDLDPEITFYVVDRTSALLPHYDTRRLVFRSGSTYAYSSIYLDKNRRIQPIYEIVQRLAESYFPKMDQLESALVLGCAGCSVPRFLALSNENCRIDGVEYSEKMVEIARKHFINDPIFDHFHLIHDDAFSFVKKTKEKYNFSFVDIFQAETNHPMMLSDDFLHDVNSITEKESISVFNLLSLSREECMKFALRHVGQFSAAYVFDEMFHYYVIFVKTAKPSDLKGFENRATKYVRLLERYVSH